MFKEAISPLMCYCKVPGAGCFGMFMCLHGAHFPLTTAVISIHFDSQNKSSKMFLYTQTNPNLKQSGWLCLPLSVPAKSR